MRVILWVLWLIVRMVLLVITLRLWRSIRLVLICRSFIWVRRLRVASLLLICGLMFLLILLMSLILSEILILCRSLLSLIVLRRRCLIRRMRRPLMVAWLMRIVLRGSRVRLRRLLWLQRVRALMSRLSMLRMRCVLTSVWGVLILVCLMVLVVVSLTVVLTVL